MTIPLMTSIPQTGPLTLKRLFTGSRNYQEISHLIFKHFAYMTNTRQPGFRMESFRKYKNLLLRRSYRIIWSDKVGLCTSGNELKAQRTKWDMISNDGNLYLGFLTRQNGLEEEKSEKMWTPTYLLLVSLSLLDTWGNNHCADSPCCDSYCPKLMTVRAQMDQILELMIFFLQTGTGGSVRSNIVS